MALVAATPIIGAAGSPATTGATAEQPSGADLTGTAFGLGPTPAGPPAPLTGLRFLLLPRSEALLQDLDRIRTRSRDSMEAYRSAIPELRRAVDAAVAGLRATGGESAVRQGTEDGAGRFTVPAVPAGQWMLVAYRTVWVDRRGHDTVKESGTFLPQPKLVGYDRVSMWLEPVSVKPGDPPIIELTDRNVWFEGVEERTTSRERLPSTGNRRRSAR